MKRFLAWLSSTVIHFIGWSLRMTIEDRGGILDQPAHPPVIIAFWHNRTALMAYFYEQPRRAVQDRRRGAVRHPGGAGQQFAARHLRHADGHPRRERR
jgi:hypothetical protein